LLGVHNRVDTTFFPPLLLVAHGVEGTVVGGAEGHGPFVTHLAAHGAGLGKTYVMGMTW